VHVYHPSNIRGYKEEKHDMRPALGKNTRFNLKNNKENKAESVAEVVEHLPRK
jgi:hypothetical protein